MLHKLGMVDSGGDSNSSVLVTKRVSVSVIKIVHTQSYSAISNLNVHTLLLQIYMHMTESMLTFVLMHNIFMSFSK